MNRPAQSFEQSFESLTDHRPFPWQADLYARLIVGEIPRALDVPTGMGKTSVMAIWLLARRQNPHVPRRLVYVVNRRTIVDQATKIAEELRRKSEEPLLVSTLRGALADNREWLRAPHAPAIIVGTVDMIGSRLLFNGYRAGQWQRARHAGLLGYDALLVHDEAHLSKPFEELLRWIETRQPTTDKKRFQVLAMSATAENSHADREILRISSQDREIAGERLNATKRVYLHSTEKLDPKHLAVLAVGDTTRVNRRVIVFVRLPDIAAKTVEQIKVLHKAVHGEGLDGRIELLTGTIRGHERDILVERPVLRHLLHGWESDEPRTEYLVSNSAGEVGADFDADDLVGDLTTIDAQIQRIGRVNRRGGAVREARIDIVLDRAKNATSKIDVARSACAEFLEKLREERGEQFSASPSAITGNSGAVPWRDRPGYIQACEPDVQTVKPHDVTLDAWSLTSIQDDWPLALEVDPYLHGIENESPQTFVAWRAELDELTVLADGPIDLAPVRKILQYFQLRPQELLHDRSERVADLLTALKQSFPNRPVVEVIGRTTVVSRLRDLPNDRKRLSDRVRSRTLVLPLSVGGLNTAGMIDENAHGPVLDVAENQEPRRARILLRRVDDEPHHFRSMRIANRPSATEIKLNEELSSLEGRWTAIRDQLSRSLNLRFVSRIILVEDDLGPSRMLLIFRDQPSQQQSSAPLTVERHNSDVAGHAVSRATALALSSTEIAAVQFAAAHHDLGKSRAYGDGRWQDAINGHKDQTVDLAKTLGKGMNVQILDGYRHEFGSLLAAVKSDAFQKLDRSSRDLALHLIATHHGRGRPHFAADAMKIPIEHLPPELLPAEIARRFDRLQRLHGHWRLAWLEAVFMSADAQASADHDATPGEDENETDSKEAGQ